MNERCYFAHPITDYDTPREAASLEVIQTAGFIPENPNTPEHNAAYKVRGMEHFVEVVSGCDSLAFQRFPEGQIGAGIYKEIEAARREQKPIFEIAEDELLAVPENIKLTPVLTVDETRLLIASIRHAR